MLVMTRPQSSVKVFGGCGTSVAHMLAINGQHGGIFPCQWRQKPTNLLRHRIAHMTESRGHQ